MTQKQNSRGHLGRCPRPVEPARQAPCARARVAYWAPASRQGRRRLRLSNVAFIGAESEAAEGGVSSRGSRSGASRAVAGSGRESGERPPDALWADRISGPTARCSACDPYRSSDGDPPVICAAGGAHDEWHQSSAPNVAHLTAPARSAGRGWRRDGHRGVTDRRVRSTWRASGGYRARFRPAGWVSRGSTRPGRHPGRQRATRHRGTRRGTGSGRDPTRTHRASPDTQVTKAGDLEAAGKALRQPMLKRLGPASRSPSRP